MKLFILPALTIAMMGHQVLAQQEEVTAQDTAVVAESEDMQQDATQEMLESFGAVSVTDTQKHKHPKACAEVKLTDEQKKAMKEAFFTYKKENLQLHTNLKLAKMDYERNLASDKGDTATATKLGEDINKDVSALVSSHLALANQIFFTILTPEQRGPAALCHRHMKKHHHHMKCMGAKGHEGKHPGHGPHEIAD